jgi:hypothetical protein
MVQVYANHLPTSVDRYTDHRRGFLLIDLASVYAFGAQNSLVSPSERLRILEL